MMLRILSVARLEIIDGCQYYEGEQPGLEMPFGKKWMNISAGFENTRRCRACELATIGASTSDDSPTTSST